MASAYNDISFVAKELGITNTNVIFTQNISIVQFTKLNKADTSEGH